MNGNTVKNKNKLPRNPRKWLTYFWSNVSITSNTLSSNLFSFSLNLLIIIHELRCRVILVIVYEMLYERDHYA